MSVILDEFRYLIPHNSVHSGTGWTNFNCPACGDTRKRGGILFTPEGGFRYYCFNGGCEYNARPTGWEDGWGFGGRIRALFELLGGDIRRIPLDEILKYNNKRIARTGEVIGEGEKLEVETKFPEVSLPVGCDLLVDWARKDRKAIRVLEWLTERDRFTHRTFPYQWSPKHPNHVIVPFFHFRNKIVGYLGRNIKAKTAKNRFIGKAPSDYLFNQHLLSLQSYRYAFIVESPMDAIQLECVATRGDRMTKKQINLLKLSGKEPILIPDYKDQTGLEFINIAKENQWFVSLPDFIKDSGMEDVSDSLMGNGKLFTIYQIVHGKTKNYDIALMFLQDRIAGQNHVV